METGTGLGWRWWPHESLLLIFVMFQCHRCSQHLNSAKVAIQPFSHSSGWFVTFALFDKQWTFNNSPPPPKVDISAREIKIIDGKYRSIFLLHKDTNMVHRKSSAFSARAGETTLCWQYTALWNELLAHCLTRPNGKQHCASFIVGCLYIVCELVASEQYAPPVASICWHQMNKCDSNTPY